jgi:hypothetical protein
MECGKPPHRGAILRVDGDIVSVEDEMLDRRIVRPLTQGYMCFA